MLPGLGTSLTVGGEAFEEELVPLSGARVLARFANGEVAAVETPTAKAKPFWWVRFWPWLISDGTKRGQSGS